MKNLINYLAPRILVIAATLYALKMTVWPTMSLPISATNWLQPVWKATAALKQTVTEPGVIRTSTSASSISVDVSAKEEPFTIEICPAGSQPSKLTKSAASAAQRSSSQAPSSVTITPKASRVAASTLP